MQDYSKPTKSAKAAVSRTGKWVLRCLLLDLPLMVLFGSYLTMLLLEQMHLRYWNPLRLAFQWNDLRRDVEVTSYHYQCTEDDISTLNADDLIITGDMTADDAVKHQQVHGASIFPSILSNQTANSVRQFILEENLKQEGFWVIEGKNRYSFGIRVDQHPSVAKALQEIGAHSKVTRTLERLVGPNPAVIEFTAITSTYGASTQFNHQDVLPEGSAAKYGRSFVPSYSLFIPLQDTTEEMGATDLCPGTQMCGSSVVELCDEYGFSAASTSSGIWPKGWGALVNQQTTHRGTAHTDPNGPERVVFILTFAPRPRYDSLPGIVESRMIGTGGSYSMNWHHWGHTLEDFRRSAQAMAEPWRTLRALGIYKPGHAQWGWDFITVAMMRMANGDNGYTREELVTFGGFKLLPKWLQAPIDEDYDEDSEEEDDGGWYDYLLGTGEKVKEALAIVNLVVLATFLVGLSLVSVLHALVHKRIQVGLSTFGRGIGRLLLTHGSLVALALLFLYRVNSSYWARHIQNGKLFRPYNISLELSKMEAALALDAEDDDEEEKEIIFNPYTLPNRNDLLTDSHYQSRYLASWAHIMDYNQPGNKRWKELVHDNSLGFDDMTPSMQDQFCEFLVADVMYGEYQARFLKQSEGGRWSELLLSDAKSYCHKELMIDNDPLTRVLLNEIAYLQTETNVGAWRGKAIHRSTIASYLIFWTETLLSLRQQKQAHQESLPATSKKTSKDGSLFMKRKRLIPTIPFLPLDWKTPSGMPSSHWEAEEPFTGAWLKSGDIIEGKYNGEHNEWYRGIITDVSTDGDSYHVMYDDGEEDYDLCRRCVRQFKPYSVGDKVDARLDYDEDFFRATVVAVRGDEMYDIAFRHNNEVYPYVHSSNLRRFR